MGRLFPKLTASALQATAYLLGVALFSISFLVFLNSSISFVVTEIIGQKEQYGDVVGTLGFADELLALVACPLWGMLSDRIGVRAVAVTGYCIIAISLVSLVQSTNVYPELLLGRLVFSLGAAACSTMVTAVLPTMVADKAEASKGDTEQATPNGHAERLRGEDTGRNGSIGHVTSPSLNSELTITPASFASASQRGRHATPKDFERREAGEEHGIEKSAGTSQLAGLVGFFTGAGALLALTVFLPLAAYFQNGGREPAESLRFSFYVVAVVALCVALFVFLGLRRLPGEENKKWASLLKPPYDETTRVDSDGHLHTILSPAPSWLTLATQSLKLGFTDQAIGLGYLGGFVARASSVAISLFIPFFVNAYYKRTGLCKNNPHNLPDVKKNCEDAYKLAAALGGIAELAALICAPLFGWLGGRAVRGKSEWPLLVASILGIIGYTSFGLLEKPDPFHGEGGQWALISVVLIGTSQIGAIVCSLGLLGRGVSQYDKANKNVRELAPAPTTTTQQDDCVGGEEEEETAGLLSNAPTKRAQGAIDRPRLKGSIAGMYSFAGGAGILLLTKLGGALFDSWHTGAPFFLMAMYNGILALAIVIVGSGRFVLRRARHAHAQ